MDFFEHQHKAKQKTKLLVFYFALAVIIIVAIINTVAFQLINHSAEVHLTLKEWFVSPWFAAATLGTITVIFLGSIIRGIQISGGGQSVAKMVNARPISMNSKDKLERRLINVVEEMSIASGTTVPSLFIMDEEKGMNAFVAGLVPSDTVMVVTKGLLEKLSRQELQGVVAHEYSHIFNADMRMNVRLIGILGGILALGQLGYFLMRSIGHSRHRRSSSSSNNNQMGLVVIGIAVALLIVGYVGLFFGRLIKAAISRQREFLADASAVQYSRDSMGIANALYRIKTNGKGSLLDSSHAEDMSHMCFGNALKLSAFSGMLATHPPLDDRIKKLVPGYRPPKSTSSKSTAADEDSVISSFSDSDGRHIPENKSTEDALEIITPGQLVDSIGQVKPEQIAQAAIIHQEIPDQLIDASHSTETADCLILAMIITSSDEDQEQLLTTTGNKLSSEQLSNIKTYVPVVKTVARNLILPLIELTLPSLKQCSEQQKKNLLACSSLLITADNKIEPFEFFLYALLRKHLSKKDAGFNNSVIKKYKPVLNDIQFLLSVLAEAGGSKSKKEIAMAMNSFDPKWKIPDTLPTYDASLLNKSLQRLNRLAPLLKKPLIQMLAEMVIEDGEIKTAEIELLRATGIYLECPIPPLVIK